MLNLMNINFHNTFFAWICTRLLQYNFLHAYDVHLSSKHFYMIDPPPKNWFRFTDVAKHNKVSNISCKKSGRRIMVGNLEITAKKTEKMVGTRLRLVHHTKTQRVRAARSRLHFWRYWIDLCLGLNVCTVKNTLLFERPGYYVKVSICVTFSKESETVSRCQEQIQTFNCLQKH